MNSADYRRLRQAEMIAFFVKTWGHDGWKRHAQKAGGLKYEHAPTRWMTLSSSFTFQQSMEEWTKTLGFRSRYAEALKPFTLHAELLNRLRHTAMPEFRAKHPYVKQDASLPFNEEQLDQLFAALGYDVTPTTKGAESTFSL